MAFLSHRSLLLDKKNTAEKKHSHTSPTDHNNVDAKTALPSSMYPDRSEAEHQQNAGREYSALTHSLPDAAGWIL